MTSPGHVTGAGSVAGDVVGGFTITAQIRLRGCRAIYHAEGSGRRVILKTLCRDAAAKAHRRFDNEAAALELLSDVSVAPGLVATGATGVQRFIALEYRDGVTLRSLSRRGHRGLANPTVPPVDFATAAILLAAAVSRVHTTGIVHGDISRLNILIDDETATLVDWESSWHVRSPSQVSRRITWAYAAPELATGPPGFAADQYATAAVLYRQLTGRHCRSPRGDAPADSVQALSKPARALTTVAAKRMPTVGDVLATALEIDPDKRFGSMRAFTEALTVALAR